VPTKYIKALSKHIDKLRQERDWSFQEMANACEMDKSQVYKICTTGVDLRISSIEKLAKGFGITASDLLNF
jgi:transcriptional regulator with XRE-family HTH domain